MLAAQIDPELAAPVGAYLTDGDQLVWILESDHSGAIGEDVCTGALVDLKPADLDARRLHFWRRIQPAKDPA